MGPFRLTERQRAALELARKIVAARGKRGHRTKARDDVIRARHAAGEHPISLAREYGITRQRVHQIVHSHGKVPSRG